MIYHWPFHGAVELAASGRNFPIESKSIELINIQIKAAIHHAMTVN